MWICGNFSTGNLTVDNCRYTWLNSSDILAKSRFYEDKLCKTIDFDCYVNDFMASTGCECVLTDDDYEIVHKKYAEEINHF